MRTRWLLAAVVATVLGLCLALPSTGGALVGRITNSTNTAGVAVFGTCTNAATATGSAFFVLPLNEAAGATTAADVSGNARPGTYRNTATGVTFGAAGPCPRDGARAVTLAGLGTLGGHITSNTQVTTAPQVFSTSIWFRTTTATGGKLIGFGNTATGQSTSYDRHLYMTNAGTIVAGVYPNAIRTVATTASYNDGAWHQAVMTLAPAGNANPGLRLYVDGAFVLADTGTTSAETVSPGYWRVGFDNLNTWTNAPTNYAFTGSVAYAAVFSAALTPVQVSALYAAGR